MGKTNTGEQTSETRQVPSATDIRAATTSDGNVVAYLSDFSIENASVVFNVETPTRSKEKHLDIPYPWTDNCPLGELLNMRSVNIEELENIFQVRVEYEPDKDKISSVISVEMDNIQSTSLNNELRMLKEKSINENWISAEVTDVQSDGETVDVVLSPCLFDTNSVFEFTFPEYWDSEEYGIVKICDELNLSEFSELVGHSLAVRVGVEDTWHREQVECVETGLSDSIRRERMDCHSIFSAPQFPNDNSRNQLIDKQTKLGLAVSPVEANRTTDNCKAGTTDNCEARNSVHPKDRFAMLVRLILSVLALALFVILLLTEWSAYL